MPAVVVGAAVAAGSVFSYGQHRKAQKSALSQADTQMRMQDASQAALLAKEEAAKAELANAQQTSAQQAQAAISSKKRAIARSRTIYTSPLGIGGTADVSRKILLGQ